MSPACVQRFLIILSLKIVSEVTNMRAFWKNGQVVSLKLPENIYTITQMFEKKDELVFFNIFREQDDWHGINLNNEKILFILPTVNIVRAFGERKITNDEVIALKETQLPIIKISSFINKIENFHKGEYHLKGGCLLQEDGDENIIIKENLDVVKDRDDILNYEFDSLYIPEHVRARLLFNKMYHEDFDFFKYKIFPNLYSDKYLKKHLELVEKFDIKL